MKRVIWLLGLPSPINTTQKQQEWREQEKVVTDVSQLDKIETKSELEIPSQSDPDARLHSGRHLGRPFSQALDRGPNLARLHRQTKETPMPPELGHDR